VPVGRGGLFISLSIASAQDGKNDSPRNRVTDSELNLIKALQFTFVEYQLTDEEGGSPVRFTQKIDENGEPEFDEDGSPVLVHDDTTGRSVPAMITWRYANTRDSSKRLVFDIHVMRPPRLGGSFDKAGVAFDSGRSPGTIDAIQPGSLRLRGN
jgi:hypothetical protein